MLLNVLGCEKKELSVLITDDEEMAELNGRYRAKPAPTDVLSFPMDNEGIPDIHSPLLGDVIISFETASRQAHQLGVSLEEEICRLLIHGVLHLLGYEHENVSDGTAREMREKEQSLMDTILPL